MKTDRKVILIVDDNEALVDAMEELLEEEYQVIPTTNGYQALKVLNRLEPALIIMDCFMPGYHGVQLLREIRQMGLKSRVVVITASVSDQITEELRWLGADGLLRKPFDVDQITNYAAAS